MISLHLLVLFLPLLLLHFLLRFVKRRQRMDARYQLGGIGGVARAARFLAAAVASRCRLIMAALWSSGRLTRARLLLPGPGATYDQGQRESVNHLPVLRLDHLNCLREFRCGSDTWGGTIP